MQSGVRWSVSLSAAVVVGALFTPIQPEGRAQSLDLNPTRPTVANSAAIQDKGVLQLELGYDGYPDNSESQHTISTLFTYVPIDHLRLDFGWSPYAQEDESEGLGTLQAGGKVELHKEDFHRAPPGVAVQYEAEFPTATSEGLQNRGQQFILLLNHHYLKNGDLGVIANGSLVQANCLLASRCSYGGQQSFAVSYHLNERTRLYSEVFDQNTSESNTPPGTYIFAGAYRKITNGFGIDGGVRFGVTDNSRPFGLTIGIVVGKRLHSDTRSSSKGRS